MKKQFLYTVLFYTVLSEYSNENLHLFPCFLALNIFSYLEIYLF